MFSYPRIVWEAIRAIRLPLMINQRNHELDRSINFQTGTMGQICTQRKTLAMDELNTRSRWRQDVKRRGLWLSFFVYEAI